MRNRILMIALICLVSAMLPAGAHSQEDMVAVDNSVFANARRTPALFAHDTHNETAGIEACSECHHVYADGKLVEDESSEGQACSDCHGAAADGRQPGLMKAFHLNCKGCHLKRKAGPVMCGQCHKKER